MRVKSKYLNGSRWTALRTLIIGFLSCQLLLPVLPMHLMNPMNLMNLIQPTLTIHAETFNLGEDGWQPAPKKDPATSQLSRQPDYVPEIKEARQLIAQKKYGKAHKRIKRWIWNNPGHPQIPYALLAKADALIADGDYYDALYDLEEIAREHPQSDVFEDALRRELEIARLFISGLPRRRLWMRIGLFKVNSEAREILITMQQRVPGSDLGEQASLLLSDDFFKRSMTEEAAVAYEMFLINYPKSIHREQAMLMLIRCHLANYKGPEFEEAPLIEARERLRQYTLEFPLQAERLGLEGLEIRIRESIALKILHHAKWYQKTGKRVSSQFLYQKLVEKYPDTDAAREVLDKNLLVLEQAPQQAGR